MKRAAIYTRISSDRTGDGAGVERQQKECRALAKRLGWTVVEVFEDNDVSAYSGKKRPAYVGLLDAMKARQIDAVIAWHPDRLTRSPRELEDLIDTINSTGVEMENVMTGDYDLTTASGRGNARMIGVWARMESERKSERQKSKAQELAEQGKLGGGGTRPYGFNQDRVTVNEAEAAVLREAADLICSGWSVRRVCRHLTEQGHRSTTGGEWYPTSLRRALVSPRVTGLREHRGEVVGDADWPAVLDREVWERVRVTLTDPARRKNRRMTRYLLTGLVHTDRGVRMMARPNTNGVRRYFALPDGDKPGGSIQADELEALVVEAVLQRFDKTKMTFTSTGTPDGLAEVESIEAELDELAQLRGENVISMREWVAAREPLQARLEAARKSAGTTGAPSALTGVLGKRGALRAAWPALTFDQRQDVLRMVIERINIAPAVRGRNTFDATRVTVDYVDA